MNHNRHSLRPLEVEGHQIEEALQALFHTVLFQRSSGKYTYKPNGAYIVGTVGGEDVDCDCIDITYVRIPSEKLHQRVCVDIKAFCDAIRAQQETNRTEETLSGEVVLQFYQKNKGTWPLPDEPVPWEDWKVTIDLVSRNSWSERESLGEKLVEDMYSNILMISNITTDFNLFVPNEPKRHELDSVFDTSFTDIQPYNFKISYQLKDWSPGEQGIMGATVKKIAQVLS